MGVKIIEKTMSKILEIIFTLWIFIVIILGTIYAIQNYSSEYVFIAVTILFIASVMLTLRVLYAERKIERKQP